MLLAQVVLDASKVAEFSNAVAPAGHGWLEPVLQYIVAPALPLLLSALGALIAVGVKALLASHSESKVARVVAVFGEMAQSAVAQIEVELVPDIRAAAADGKISAEEGAKLKAKALDILKTKAPPALLASAGSIFGPMLDTWLGGLVERANAKSEVDAPPAKTPPVPAVAPVSPQ